MPTQNFIEYGAYPFYRGGGGDGSTGNQRMIHQRDKIALSIKSSMEKQNNLLCLWLLGNDKSNLEKSLAMT